MSTGSPLRSVWFRRTPSTFRPAAFANDRIASLSANTNDRILRYPAPKISRYAWCIAGTLVLCPQNDRRNVTCDVPTTGDDGSNAIRPPNSPPRYTPQVICRVMRAISTSTNSSSVFGLKSSATRERNCWTHSHTRGNSYMGNGLTRWAFIRLHPYISAKDLARD